MKTLLFTGANGFLGKNILHLLVDKGYRISTLDIREADINCNISTEIPLLKKHDIVLHAAGKAHSTPKTKEEKQIFFDVNYQGTINLCNALETTGVPRSFIFISTVAVYGCDYGYDITESHPLNGTIPYALSKIRAEQYLVEWCRKNSVILSILRPSLLAGPNPPGNLGAMINGIKTGRYFSISGGKARKSVLLIQDIANLVPLLQEKGGIYNVCDDEHPSFHDLEILIARQLGKYPPLSIPSFVAKTLARCGDIIGDKAPINSNKLSKIVKDLTFSNKKAKEILGWKPLNVLDNFQIE
jgi:nucleoside-diphosphate-sugar epimerase